MSKATKRKHVMREVTDEFVLPDEQKQIVRVVASRGNNLHEVETDKAVRYLASMPTKFRKNIWIKRGDFVLVESIEEGDKVKAEISHILYKEQIKYIKAEGKWPSAFSPKVETDIGQMIPKDLLPPSDEDSDCEPLTANPNRPLMATGACSDTDSDTDTDSDVCDEGTTDGEVHVTREAVHFN